MQNLPLSGPVARAVRGNSWTETEHLIADVYDAVEQSTQHITASFAGKQPRKAKGHPRPGDEKGKRIGDRGERSTEDVVAYLDSLSSDKTKREREKVG